VQIPLGPLGPASLQAITASFEAAYRLLYSRTPQGVPLEALNWRAVVAGPAPVSVAQSADGGSAGPRLVSRSRQARRADTTVGPPQLKGSRKAYFPEIGGYVETPVYDRYALGPGARLAGPAIVEERESTTVVGPGAVVTVDAHRTLVAAPAAAEGR
jgi:N-methylhydantoinase A/oxoprolinase/acetone carboxylase beta subunit